MEITIALAISILGSVISVSSFVLNRKDNSNKHTAEEQYRSGVLDEKLKTIMDKLEKIESKLDFYDKEMDERINRAIDNHIKIYHKKGE